MRSPSRDPARFPHDPSVPSVHEDLVAGSPYEQHILREHAAAEGVVSVFTSLPIRDTVTD